MQVSTSVRPLSPGSVSVSSLRTREQGKTNPLTVIDALFRRCLNAVEFAWTYGSNSFRKWSVFVSGSRVKPSSEEDCVGTCSAVSSSLSSMTRSLWAEGGVGGELSDDFSPTGSSVCFETSSRCRCAVERLAGGFGGSIGRARGRPLSA